MLVLPHNSPMADPGLYGSHFPVVGANSSTSFGGGNLT